MVNGHAHPIAAREDRSRYFRIVLRRGSGKYLVGNVHGESFWSPNLNDALRFWSPTFAAQMAETLKETVHAVDYFAARALEIRAKSGA